MALNMFASFRGYVFSSFLLTAVVISHAVYLKHCFYPSVVFLSKSKFAILAVANMGLVSVLLLWRLVQAIFLGPLRFREVERLHIRARDAVIECCFAISVFRDDFQVKFVALVLALLLVKSLHWLSKDRIEFLEEQPLSPLRTHVRLVGLMTILLAVDLYLVRRFALLTFKTNGPPMFVLFVFEFSVLVIELISDMVRYCFLVIDNSMEGHWEDKGMFSFYIELLSDLCQLTMYMFFFVYVQVHYSFPYHIIRELYVTFHKFKRRCTDFLRYRRVVATMNDLFADATAEELAEGDRTCIICREEMEAAKKLACGHIFHARCLQSWLKRQLSCPTCRATIDVNNNSQANPNHQHPNQGNNNNNNPNYNNNPNIPAPPNNQRPANIGEAGARLVNVANQWWNQVMNEAAGGIGPNGRRRAVPLPGAQADAPAVPDGANAGALPGAADVPRDAGDADAVAANVEQANARLRPGQANIPLMPNFGGMGANLFMRGPNANALAHMQLRARRRGAWPHPYQQFPMHGQNLQQGPQNGGVNYNPYLGPHVPGHQGNGARGEGDVNNAVANPNGGSGAAVSEGRGAEDGNRDESQGDAGMAGSSGAGPSSGNIGTANTGLNRVGEGMGGVPQGMLGSQVRSLNQAGSSGSQQGRGVVRLDSIPLERLLAMQEQIEMLRSEVMEILLLATTAPSPSISERIRETDVNGRAGRSDSNGRTETEGVGEGRGLNENREEEDESDAAIIRRRRMEFLSRNSNA